MAAHLANLADVRKKGRGEARSPVERANERPRLGAKRSEPAKLKKALKLKPELGGALEWGRAGAQ